jgi:MSHA biogenesis protein MshL
MTDNRILMTTIKITGALALSLVLTACSNNPLMRSATATSTDAADAIDRSLEEAAQPEPAAPTSGQASAPLPADVSAALLPPLSGGSDLDERFDVSARGVPAASFFESLVEGTRYNVVVHPDVDTSIDLRLGDVTVPEVMDIAGDLYGLDIRRSGRFFRVQTDQIQTRLFPIDYLHFKRKGGSETRVSSGQVTGARSGSSGNSNGDSTGSGETRNLVGTTISTETASDFWQDIQSALSMIVGGGNGQQVIVNPGAGLVMVRAGTEDLRMVEEYLRRTELIMQRQVILEAKILEIGLNENYQQGINWSDIQSASSVIASDGLPAEFTAQALSGQVIQTSDIGGLFPPPSGRVVLPP